MTSDYLFTDFSSFKLLLHNKNNIIVNVFELTPLPLQQIVFIVGFKTTYAISAYHHLRCISLNPAQARCAGYIM